MGVEQFQVDVFPIIDPLKGLDLLIRLRAFKATQEKTIPWLLVLAKGFINFFDNGLFVVHTLFPKRTLLFIGSKRQRRLVLETTMSGKDHRCVKLVAGLDYLKIA